MKAKALYRISAVLFVFCAAGHTYGFLSFKAPDARGAAVREAVDRVPLEGAATWGSFFMGFGLVISAYFVFSAILAWGLGNLSIRPADGFGLVAWSFAVLQAATLVLTLVYIGAPPAVFSGVAAALLGWAAFRAGSAGTLH